MDEYQQQEYNQGYQDLGYGDQYYDGGYGDAGDPSMGVEYGDYGSMGYEFAFDANGRHITAFENRPNPKIQVRPPGVRRLQKMESSAL